VTRHRRLLALLQTSSFALSLAGPILMALVGFTVFAAEVGQGSELRLLLGVKSGQCHACC